eukprot:5803010-Pyramimonas_sp.AAC.1
MKWVGPSDYQTDYAQRFGRAVNLTGEALMVASDMDRKEEYSKLARIQKNHVPPDEIELDDPGLVERIPPPGMIDRFDSWKDHASKG